MSDIVERLHTRAAECERTTAHDNKDHYLHVVAKLTREDGSRMKEAADEIERLRAALERIDKMEAYYEEDSRDFLYGKICVMRGIALARRGAYIDDKRAYSAFANSENASDPECTCCGGTGITYQTERRCACQPPPTPAERREGMNKIVHEIRDNPEKIWLEPGCSPERCWCENPLDDCEEPGCGAKAIGYVREDIVEHAAREAGKAAARIEQLEKALTEIYKKGLHNQGGAYKNGFYDCFKIARRALGIPHMSFDAARAALEGE